MSQDEFTKLFVYMEKRFNEIEKRLDQKADKEQVDRIYASLDGIAKRLDADEQERAAILHQLKRHDHWIHQLAQNTKTKLSPVGA